ncbi:MAG: hypothetical protein WAL98_17825 [Desulfatiglandaceae bacterium]
MGTMMTSDEVVSFAGVREPGVRLFFRPFLIVHLAQNTDMDGYLGFMPPKPQALLWIYAKPQIVVHSLRSV